MKNTYLLGNVELKSKISEMEVNDNCTVDISDVKDTNLWIASFYISANDKNSANILSQIHQKIIQYSPIVLTCESSAYYNKVLYPLVNSLERALRQLLYLAASISQDDESKANINELESKDFGQIFDLLFIDTDFIKNIKKRVNADPKSEYKGFDRFSKEEILQFLQSSNENTLWDKILGPEAVPTLRKRFREVQTYRNDVMHAHNIDKEIYGKAYYLFTKINQELDEAIGNIIGNKDNLKVDITENINLALANALSYAKALEAKQDIWNIKISQLMLNDSFYSEIQKTIHENIQNSMKSHGVYDYKISDIIDQYNCLRNAEAENISNDDNHHSDNEAATEEQGMATPV